MMVIMILATVIMCGVVLVKLYENDIAMMGDADEDNFDYENAIVVF